MDIYMLYYNSILLFLLKLFQLFWLEKKLYVLYPFDILPLQVFLFFQHFFTFQHYKMHQVHLVCFPESVSANFKNMILNIHDLYLN